MKGLAATIMVFTMLFIGPAIYAEEQTAAEPPSVAAPLVREGDFAMKLVSALNLGSAGNEAEAESILAVSGIAPRNGWISDYPVTPDIIAELQNSVGDAADANRLPMGRAEALKVMETVQASTGLAAVVPEAGQYAETEPPATPEYADPGVINNYYYEEGPPVVTYYPPPWDYYYLYAWVPSPFWFSGFFFPGFFILHDFHRSIFFDHRHAFVSNHFFDRDRHRFSTIDPGRRRNGGSFRAMESGRRAFTSEGRRGAQSIFQRSRDRSSFPQRNFNGRGGERAPQVAPRGSFRGFSQGSRTFKPPARMGAGSFNRGATMGSRGFSGGGRGGGVGHGGSFGGFPGGGFRQGASVGGFRGGGFGHGASLGGFHGGGSGHGGSFGGFHGGFGGGGRR